MITWDSNFSSSFLTIYFNEFAYISFTTNRFTFNLILYITFSQ